MRATSPPEDVHALDVAGLVAPSVRFFSCRSSGALLGIGALQVTPSYAEVKSMHTAASARGRGVARMLLSALLVEPGPVFLETGTQEAFAPARALYRSVGFVECAPFGEYVASVHSTFMTLVR